MSFQYIPGGQVEVPEIPFRDKVLLPAQQSAVIVVDMQNDFCKAGGTLVVPPALDSVPNIQQLLAAARAQGVHIAYTQDTHYTGDREWTIWPKHTEAGTWGWQIIDELAPQLGDMVFPKPRYDGFYNTSLEHYLRVWGVEHLVIVGTISSICVLHTAASAGLRWFHVVAAADGMTALTNFDQAMTLRQISWLYAGEVTRSVADIAFGD